MYEWRLVKLLSCATPAPRHHPLPSLYRIRVCQCVSVTLDKQRKSRERQLLHAFLLLWPCLPACTVWNYLQNNLQLFHSAVKLKLQSTNPQQPEGKSMQATHAAARPTVSGNNKVGTWQLVAHLNSGLLRGTGKWAPSCVSLNLDVCQQIWTLCCVRCISVKSAVFS